LVVPRGTGLQSLQIHPSTNMKSKFKSYSYTTSFAVLLATVGLFSFLLSTASAADNIAVGIGAGASATSNSDNIDIGNPGNSGDTKTIRLGTTGTQTSAYMAGIYGVPISSSSPVVIDASGHLGTSSPAAGLDENLNGNAAFKGNTAAENVNALLKLTITKSGMRNTATGWEALTTNESGSDNTANGFKALHELGTKNSTANENTATGSGALYMNLATGNTATGHWALYKNTTGDHNTATGHEALYYNSSGAKLGQAATLGSNNTADGDQALFNNTGGEQNTATGDQALHENKTADRNTAIGFYALYNNDKVVSKKMVPSSNTAIGVLSLQNNTTGARNTAAGDSALSNNTDGYYNTAVGYSALSGNQTGRNSTAQGYEALNHSTGDANIALGEDAGTKLVAGSNNIYIGNQGQPGDGTTIRIGDEVASGYPDGTVRPAHTATFIAGITAAPTLSNTMPVVIDPTTGQLGCHGSSQRFKSNIKPMDQSSDVVLALKPVTFHYNNDDTDTAQFGLIAEEVEKVKPDLVVRDAGGKVFGVRYDAVNAMVLNEFLKQHRKVEEQGATIAKQQKQIEALTAGLQKVSARIEAAKASTRLVENSQ
jgi:hypothetical protein